MEQSKMQVRFVAVSSLVALALVTPVVASAASKDAPAITWKADYGKALEETREESRPLLIVLDNPADKAQSLDARLLKQDAEGLSFDSYELCRIDVSTEYGKRVADVFHATEFPHTAIIDRTGSMILRRVEGNVSTKQWKETLARYEAGISKTATTHTVSKPIVNETAATAAPVSYSTSAPAAVEATTYAVPGEVYSAPAPYCPSCQLRNRGY
jgi:hypothetical protein